MNIEIEDIFYDTNDFQIIPKEIGHGAFGKVYIARHKTTKKDYAIKIINTEESFNSRKQAQFLRESLILRNIHHPSVVKYIGINFQSFQDESKLQPSIITEYLKNGSLKKVLCDERLAQAHFEWNSTKKYITLIGIANAMRYLHKQGIIHRDLKPENILLDENFNPKICDFGLSRCFSQELTKSYDLTMTGQVGTATYMAPEILENNDDTGHYSIAIDIYAFGIIAYEIITGKKPYYELGKINAVSLGIKVLNGHRPTFTKDVSEKMKELITRCLKKNPIERPSFDEIYDKLTNDYEHSIDPINKEEVEIYIETLIDDKNNEMTQSQKMKNDQSLLKSKEDKIKQLEKEKSQIQGKYDKLMQENEQNKKNINDLDFDVISNMISSREDAFFYARFYESVDLYNEAFAMFKKMVTYGACLSIDEKEFLSSTCKQIVCKSRNAIQSIDYIINESTFVNKKRIEFLIQNKKLLCSKIEKFCNEVIDLIDKQIFPAVRDNESIIFCEKTKADYWRYICESNPESKIINKAKQSYENAIQMAETSFKKVNSTILGIYLNYSVFLFEITGEKQRALDYSQMIYNKYSNAIKDLSNESYQICSVIMQLISDNISYWKDELKK